LLIETYQMGFELDDVVKLLQQSAIGSKPTKKGS
jgi:hypothetical protein